MTWKSLDSLEKLFNREIETNSKDIDSFDYGAFKGVNNFMDKWKVCFSDDESNSRLK